MPWMDEELERDGPLSLWFQIAHRLRTAIDKGEFRPGDLLPSEDALNRRFGISRTTSRAALNALEQEGRIRRRSGLGSIVQPARVDQPLDSIGGFAEDMRARGYQPSYRARRVTTVRLRQEEAFALNLAPSSRAILVDRVLLADGEPIAVSRSLLNPNALKGHNAPTADEMDQNSLYEWLENVCGVRPVSGEELIQAAAADEETASALSVGLNTPILIVCRTLRDQLARPVEYVTTQYRADRYRLKISLARR